MGHEGFKLDVPHCAGCLAEARGDGSFVIVDRNKPFSWDRDRIGRRNGSTMWWRFICNDTHCRAVALVRWDVITAVVHQGLKTTPTADSPPVDRISPLIHDAIVQAGSGWTPAFERLVAETIVKALEADDA